MGVIINYNQKGITLYYSNKSLLEADLKNLLNIETEGSGEGRNYKQVEQEAQLYLIKNAMLERPNRRLKKIVGISQDVIYDQDKKGLELKIILKGTAIFK